MSASSLYVLSITLAVVILTVESVYHVYTYDDGHGNDEHCCLVRVRDEFCLATPITRSLIQVNKKCHQMSRQKRRRSGRGKKGNEKYLDKISQRLNVESVREMKDNILLELRQPLAATILNNDLVCLASMKNSIDLDKCYIELVNPLDDDMNEGNEIQRKRKRSKKHRGSDHRKRAVTKSSKNDQFADDEIKMDQDEAKHEVNQIEVGQPIRIREGKGLATQQTYRLNMSNIRPVNHQERQCLSWYHRQMRKLRQTPSKHHTSCIDLSDHREQCLHQLIYATFNSTAMNQREQRPLNHLPLSMGSKLFCDSHHGHNKMIGIHARSQICFPSHHQVTIEHLFTDIANLADETKNKETLEFIGNNSKFQAEFDNDCLGETTLAEVTEPVKKRRAISDENSSIKQE